MRCGNIGIKDGRIEYIGDGEPAAGKTVDVERAVISPGFIDIHMHEEDFVNEGLHYCIAEMMLQMGVTSAVGGNCGIQHQSTKVFKNTIQKLNGAPINYLVLAGYNDMRKEMGIGTYESVSLVQRTIIRDRVRKELQDGAAGISFGIEYDPGITLADMVDVCGAAESDSYLIAAHYRGDGNRSLQSIREMIELAGSIRQKFQISHLSSCSAMGTMNESLELIHIAMSKNRRLNYDTYPYSAFSTQIGSSVFVYDCFEHWGKDYSDILLTDEPYKNVRCNKEIFEDARARYPEMLAVAFVMNESEIEEAVSDSLGMIASDAILKNGNGHPRAFGTFPRVLGHYVRERKSLTLLDALRKITAEPARRLSLKDRGSIAVGNVADLTVFDPDTIIDKADYTELRPPEGIKYVFVNGVLAVDKGRVVNDRAGGFINFNDVAE